MELRYLRDTDGREVDFVVLRDRVPWCAVEAKTGEREIGRAVRYFQARTAIPRWFQVHRGQQDAMIDGVRCLPFAALCDALGIP